MDDQMYLEIRKIGEDIVFVKTTLDNMAKNNDSRLEAMEKNNAVQLSNLEQKFEDKIKVANHRIEDLEDQNKWLWRTIGGSIIGVIISVIFAFAK